MCWPWPDRRIGGGGGALPAGTAGAYGAVMSSEYNARPLVPEVLVHGGAGGVFFDRPQAAAIPIE